MNNYDEQQKNFLEAIKAISGITFLRFEDMTEGWVKVWLTSKPLSKISISDHTDDEIISWVIDILEQEKISGEFVIRFEYDNSMDLSRRAPYARVILDNPETWLKSIWQKGLLLDLISPQRDYCLFFQWSEHCLSNNCYAAYRGVLPADQA